MTTAIPARGVQTAMRQLACLGLLLAGIALFDPATAAHAAVGTPVADVELSMLDGGKSKVMGDAQVNALVFVRPGQERSVGALRELARCQRELAGKSVRWAVVVSDASPADAVAAMVSESGFAAPVFVDAGDELYGSLGISLHPVVVLVGSDRKLAAFEPFSTLDYCAVVSARIRRALGEISDDELRNALEPPKAVEGGNGQVARRYRALAAALFKSGNYDKALDYARKSIDKDARLAAAHALVGQILLVQGDCAAAAQAFGKALEIEPSNAQARDGAGGCKPAR